MPTTTDVLVDTNILLRTQFDKPIQTTNATLAVVELRRSGARIAAAIQSFAEFVNVSTRPQSENGYGLSIRESLERVQYFEASFDLLSESPLSFAVWKRLLMDFQVKGKQVHDARIASVMLASGIRRILTFNTRDFERFPEIEVLHPDQVLGK